MAGLKFRLGFTVLVLLAAAMLLVNLVVMLLWQRDLLGRERDLGELEYRRAVAILAASPQLQADALLGELGLAEGSCVAVVDLQGNRSIAPEGCRFVHILSSRLTETLESGQETTRFAGSAWGVFSGRYRVVVVSGPLLAGASLAGGVAVAHSLDPAFSRLQGTERIILVYILINLLILGVIGFFRMSDLVIRPIERLINRADQYGSSGDPLFVADQEGSEFHRLGTSLSRLVARIEKDRSVLQETVTRLDLVNRRLKENQEEMIRTEKLASVGRLAAGLAHEIGNPLGIVQGYLGILGQKEIDEQTRRECRQRAEEELQRVSGLIRQLLDFSRTSAGRNEPVSVHRVLMAVLDIIRRQPLVSDIRLETDLHASQDTVLADADQLRQVFLNCLLNGADAVRAADRGADGWLQVETETAPDPDTGENLLLIRIRDNGIGVEAETLNNIFDPFFTTKEPGRGTGLGLSVSLAIVESVGGSMEMRSEPGKGSVMRVALPLWSGERPLAGEEGEGQENGLAEDRWID